MIESQILSSLAPRLNTILLFVSILATEQSHIKYLFLRTTGRIFEIQTASIQVWSKWWQKNIGAENRLPVLTGKGYLLISWELLDGFSKFKRHMLRFDRSDDLTFSTLEIYFRCDQKNWKWTLKHYFWKYFPFRIERATTSLFHKMKKRLKKLEWDIL